MSDTITLIQRSQQGDRDASERLVTENTGLIWSIARRYFGRGVEPDDLFQLGCVGFLKAVEGFDTAYGTQFSTYAVPKIAGEIRRFLRDDGLVKVSRGMKEQGARITQARIALEPGQHRMHVIGQASNGAIDAFVGEQQQAFDLAGVAQLLQGLLPVRELWQIDELVKRGGKVLLGHGAKMIAPGPCWGGLHGLKAARSAALSASGLRCVEQALIGS